AQQLRFVQVCPYTNCCNVSVWWATVNIDAHNSLENATHKQNCTSFNPKRVITHYVNNGKPFLNVSRSFAQIIR
ncbi:hypothetical protein CQA46_26380, partial [Escherichia coli]